LGWGPDQAPTAPDGFEVVRFADSLNSPRHVYVAPNGDIFVAQARTEKEGEDAEKIDSRNAFRDKSPNEIILFKDTDNDGKHDSQQVILKDLSNRLGC